MNYFNERVFKTIPIDSFEDLKKYMRRCHAFVMNGVVYYPILVSRDKNNGQWIVKAVYDNSSDKGDWITYDEILSSNNPYFVYYIDEYELGGFKIDDPLDNIINESIENKILYIIRGIPGSGKSTLANKLTSNVVEADQFMYEDGEYKWKPEKLHMAHKKCQETVEQYMQEGRDKIAVANTFIKLKEIKPYIDLAKQYDYKIVVKECDGGFQNVHNVPEETLEKMKSKFQPYKDEEMNESKQLTESILYDDLAYNDWNEKYEQLTVIANPSIDWLRNQLNSDDCWGFRFLHNTERNKLYVWDCKQPWMHQQVFDMVDMDWGKPGTNVVGIFEPNCVAVWEELADDGEAESSIALAKKLDGKLFKELSPDGYEMTTCC